MNTEKEKNPGTIEHILLTATGHALGVISKKLFVGTSHNVFRKFVGNVGMIVIMNIVEKHPEEVKAAANVVFKFIKKITGAKPDPDEPRQRLLQMTF